MNTTAEGTVVGTAEDTTADMGITADMVVTEVMGITVDTIRDMAAVDITITN